MSTAQIREELHAAIDKADDRLLNVIYAMVQADMAEGDYALSQAHQQVLDERLKSHRSNPASGRDWDKVKADIKRRL